VTGSIFWENTAQPDPEDWNGQQGYPRTAQFQLFSVESSGAQAIAVYLPDAGMSAMKIVVSGYWT
jgi:hypothetical protein